MSDNLEKKSYELAFLVKEESAVHDLRRIVEQHEVEIQSESQLKKINLAYKIKKVGEAYFGFLRLFSEPAAMQSLARDLRTSPTTLRFLVVVLPRENRGSGESHPRPERPSLRRLPIAREVRQSQPLSNEALEKKIEEILQ